MKNDWSVAAQKYRANREQMLRESESTAHLTVPVQAVNTKDATQEYADELAHFLDSTEGKAGLDLLAASGLQIHLATGQLKKNRGGLYYFFLSGTHGLYRVYQFAPAVSYSSCVLNDDTTTITAREAVGAIVQEGGYVAKNPLKFIKETLDKIAKNFPK